MPPCRPYGSQPQTVFRHVPLGGAAQAVAAGSEHSIVVLRGGRRVVAFGRNTQGQLGIDAAATRSSFTPRDAAR